MKKLLGTLVFAAALMYGTVAQAAEINIIATRGDQPGGNGNINEWVLTIETTLPIAGLTITVQDPTATFVINAANTLIAPFGGGSSLSDAATPGFLSLTLGPGGTCTGTGCPAFAPPPLMGVFTSSLTGPGAVLIAFDDGSGGGTAFQPTLDPYADNLIEVRNVAVPEPAVAIMLGLGLAGLGLIRRKAA